MPKSEPRLEFSLDRETAWTLRRLLQRFHHGAEFEYGGRTLSDTEDRNKRLEYALADNLENQILRIMRRNGWEEEDEAPRY